MAVEALHEEIMANANGGHANGNAAAANGNGVVLAPPIGGGGVAPMEDEDGQ